MERRSDWRRDCLLDCLVDCLVGRNPTLVSRGGGNPWMAMAVEFQVCCQRQGRVSPGARALICEDHSVVACHLRQSMVVKV